MSNDQNKRYEDMSTSERRAADEQDRKARHSAELAKRATNRPTTPAAKAAFLRNAAVNALEHAGCPDISENRIAAVVSHLTIEDVAEQDPFCPLAPTDNGRKTFTVSYARVLDENRKPRVASGLTGQPEPFPVEKLIAELRLPYPLQRHASSAKLDIASGLAWA